jgi:3-hydroxy-9,10-secoandrosta-1,3,5(10)-triene-9,17-dione monooxygenase reductase component
MDQHTMFRTEDMRAVLGHFASGVVVVTATHESEPLGFTCQSFASLSLDPPLVILCPAHTSTTWPRIRRVGSFCVNILAEDQEQLSRRFARSGPDKYQGSKWILAPSGSPVFEGIVAWVDCSLRDEFDGGDHTVVVGAVHALEAHADRQPLLYHRGAYKRIPNRVMPPDLRRCGLASTRQPTCLSS